MANFCINSEFSSLTAKKYNVLHESEAFVEIIRSWTYPKEITPNDIICLACWKLVKAAEGTRSGTMPRRQMGHAHVCSLCGHSVLRSRHRKILRNNTNPQIVEIMSQWIHPRLISKQSAACVACWLKAERAVRRQSSNGTLHDDMRRPNFVECGREEQQLDEKPEHLLDQKPEYLLDQKPEQLLDQKPEHLLDLELEPQPDLELEQEPDQELEQQPDQELEQEPDQEPEQQLDQELHQQGQQEQNMNMEAAEEQKIRLPNIRRAVMGPRKCIFHGCTHRERHRIPVETQRYVLRTYHFFIPKTSRICTFHMQNAQYDTLYAAPNTMNTFSAELIEEMMFLLMERPVNLQSENINDWPDHLVQYLIGTTKAQHSQILHETPGLRDMHRGGLALAAHLCKMNTGDSGSRLAALFQVPRRTLETLMSVVKNILDRDNVPAANLQ